MGGGGRERVGWGESRALAMTFALNGRGWEGESRVGGE